MGEIFGQNCFYGSFFIVKEKMSDNSFSSFIGDDNFIPFQWKSMFHTFLEIMAAYDIKQRADALQKTKLFSISFDETTDVARTGIIMFFMI
jgi:hypothetical protein